MIPIPKETTGMKKVYTKAGIHSPGPQDTRPTHTYTVRYNDGGFKAAFQHGLELKVLHIYRVRNGFISSSIKGGSKEVSLQKVQETVVLLYKVHQIPSSSEGPTMKCIQSIYNRASF